MDKLNDQHLPHDDIVYRLRKRAEIRRQIPGRKSVEEGKPDRIPKNLYSNIDGPKVQVIGCTNDVVEVDFVIKKIEEIFNNVDIYNNIKKRSRNFIINSKLSSNDISDDFLNIFKCTLDAIITPLNVSIWRTI